jgi:hypothetical protein
MSITLIDRHGVVRIRSPVLSSKRALVAWPRFPGTLPSVIAALASPLGATAPFLPATPVGLAASRASTFDPTFTGVQARRAADGQPEPGIGFAQENPSFTCPCERSRNRYRFSF